MSRAARWGALGLANLVLFLGGCGYNTGFEVPAGVETVGVRVFWNDTQRRDLELELHRWVSDSVQRLVDAPLVSPEVADLVLDGRLLDYSKRGGIRSPDNKQLETGVRVVVEARLWRRRTPQAQALLDSEAKPDLEAGTTAQEPQSRSADPGSRGVGFGALPVPGEILWRRNMSQEMGYRIAETNGEAAARERVLRSLGDRIVLEAFSMASAPPSEQPDEQ